MRVLAVCVLMVSVFSGHGCVLAKDVDTSKQYNSKVKSLLALTNSFEPKLKKARDMVDIKPILIPLKESGSIIGVNDHFGWPVADMIDDTIVVLYPRGTQHYGSGDKPDEFTSSAMIVRSSDAGKTWSAPVDLRQYVQEPTIGRRLSFGKSITVNSKGWFVALTKHGVFRSKDKGLSWEHLGQAYGEKQLKGPKYNNGPDLIEHPEYGLLAIAFGHSKGVVFNELWFRYSKDDGQTWQETRYEIPEFAAMAEPAALIYDGHLILVGRSHHEDTYLPEDKSMRYIQAVSSLGKFEPVFKFTTIKATDIKNMNHAHGFWSQDTVALNYNPVSKRIECVATDRNGNAALGPDKNTGNQTLNLWSIDPDELIAGSSDWRYECTLMERNGQNAKGVLDGLHPAGAVIDEKRGVQYIFIYAGKRTEAGIFMITRTLDTEKLVKKLRY